MVMFITAEIGTSWKGEFDLLKKIVQKCKDVGFDAVKFQAIRKEDLNGRLWRLKASITTENIEQVDKICRQVGIEWYCMPTTREAVDILDPYVNRYKIRYKDQHDVPLLSKVLSRRKPVIISCEKAFKFFGVTSLYCISKYPHTMEEIDYEKMKEFDGFSCHCTDHKAIIRAVDSGIEYLEFHVTHDMNDKELVDNKVAFDLYDDCDLLIKVVRHRYEHINKPGDCCSCKDKAKLISKYESRNNITSKTNKQTVS